ncbi:unnamed protein product [Chrysoparadoxa australica]
MALLSTFATLSFVLNPTLLLPQGIGFAIAKGLLKAGYFVFLGSRDVSRGEVAVKALVAEEPKFSNAVQLLQLDVTDANSINSAVETVRESCAKGGTSLVGLVNNAGGGDLTESGGSFHDGLKKTLDLNVKGVMSTTTAFLPLLDQEEGRVVMVSSSSGPSFVQSCTPERQRMLCDPNITLDQINGLMDECLSLTGDIEQQLRSMGLPSSGNMFSYGLSKACVNAYTQLLAREHSNLRINACTPGFIATDLTKPYAVASGQTTAELGMKSTDDGAKVPVYLMTGDLPGNGRYYGSDGLRSPLDRYRSPGDPEYTD